MTDTPDRTQMSECADESDLITCWSGPECVVCARPTERLAHGGSGKEYRSCGPFCDDRLAPAGPPVRCGRCDVPCRTDLRLTTNGTEVAYFCSTYCLLRHLDDRGVGGELQ